MAKFIDSILFGIGIFVLTFILTYSISGNISITLISSIIISITFALSIAHIMNNKKSKCISLKNFDTYMIVKGVDYQLDTLTKLYPESDRFDKYIIVNQYILMPIFKFSPLSRDDVLKAYNIAKSSSISTIYIISNSLDRAAISFSNELYDVNFKIVRSKQLFLMLKSSNMLPVIKSRKTPTHIHFSEIFRIMTSRANAPKYLFTSVILLLIGLITPLRTYYFIMSGISSILTLMSLRDSGSDFDNSKLPSTKNKTHLPK